MIGLAQQELLRIGSSGNKKAQLNNHHNVLNTGCILRIKCSLQEYFSSSFYHQVVFLSTFLVLVFSHPDNFSFNNELTLRVP